MKNIKLTIMILIALIKRYNKTISIITELVEAITTIVDTMKKNAIIKLINVVIGMAIGKVIENYLDELIVTIIDIIKILYKYEIYMYIINSQLAAIIIAILTFQTALIINEITIIITIGLVVTIAITVVLSELFLITKNSSANHPKSICSRVGYGDLLPE
ncbi:MAG TPA: hypothetical protein PLJ00_12700 [Chitinophagales bacterium]|nr:hypothetical protein [Chitinophagales bacterium]HRG86868.1 hypothetical protein [Chitinophagales bacterium]